MIDVRELFGKYRLDPELMTNLQNVMRTTSVGDMEKELKKGVVDDGLTKIVSQLSSLILSDCYNCSAVGIAYGENSEGIKASYASYLIFKGLHKGNFVEE